MTVEANGQRQMQEVLSGGSYYSQSDFALYFGLGSAVAMDRVEVRWPNGEAQLWTKLTAGQTYTVTEAEAEPRAKPFGAGR